MIEGGGVARILVVEDNEPLRNLLDTLLTDAGHEVLLAPHGESALSIAETAPPDLVVVDCVLPGIDGIAFAGSLWSRKGLGSLPVIFYSAYGLTDGLRPLIRRPNVRFIPKERSMKNLLQQIDELLAGTDSTSSA